MKLYTRTRLAQAVFGMFTDLEGRLMQCYQNLPAGAVKAYLFGGCGVHMHTNSRPSADVDAELEWSALLKPEDIVLHAVEYEDEQGLPQLVEFDQRFNKDLAPVCPDYPARAIPLSPITDIVQLYLVSAVDIAVTKLGRLGEVDLSDIVSLYKAGGFELREFRAVAESGIDYSATPDKLPGNLEHAINTLNNA